MGSRRSWSTSGDQVGGIVGGHGREQAGRLSVRAAAHELQLVLGVQLLEDVGLQLAVGPPPPR